MINAKSIPVNILDDIISKCKMDLRKSIAQVEITKEFLEQYLHSLIIQANENRELRNQILDNADIHIISEDIAVDSTLPEEVINEKRKIRITSKTIDAVANSYSISPNEIEETLNRIITVSSFGSIYEIKDIDDNSDKRKILSIKTLLLDCEQILKVLDGNLTKEEVEEMQKNTKEICKLEIYKTNFSNAIALHDEYVKRLSTGTIFDKDFILNIGKLVKINDEETEGSTSKLKNNQISSQLTFESFLNICNKSLVLSYDLLNIIIAYSYNPSQKKTQFSIKID